MASIGPVVQDRPPDHNIIHTQSASYTISTQNDKLIPTDLAINKAATVHHLPSQSPIQESLTFELTLQNPCRKIDSTPQNTTTHQVLDNSTIPTPIIGDLQNSGKGPTGNNGVPVVIPTIQQLNAKFNHHPSHPSSLLKVSSNFDKPSFSTHKLKGSAKSAILQSVRYNAQVNTQANEQPGNSNDHHKVNPPLPPAVKPSFATTLNSIHEQTTPRIEISPAKQTSKQGYPAIIFKRDDYLVKLAERCKFTLVGKFESTMPRMEVIRRSFEAQVQLKGPVKITHFNANHVYIDLTNQLDHDTVWFKQNIWIQVRAMKLFTWTPTFRPSQETPIAPIWVVLPELPWHLYYMEVVSELFISVDRAIYLDTATFQKTRGSVAKVKLEIDVTKSRPNYIWVGFDEDENGVGYWQEVEYQEVPEYCLHCKHQGHSISVCSIKRREDDMANKNDKDKSGSTGPIKNAVLKPSTQISQLQIQQSGPTKYMTNQSTIDNVNLQHSNAQQGDTTQKKMNVRGRVQKQQYVAKPVSLIPEKATSGDQIGGKSVDQIGGFSDLAMNQIGEKSVDLVCTNAFDFLADWDHVKHSSTDHKTSGNLLATTGSASQNSSGKVPGMTASKQQIESTKSWVERSFGKTDRVAPSVGEADNDTGCALSEKKAQKSVNLKGSNKFTVLAQVLSDNEDATIAQNQAHTVNSTKQACNAVGGEQHSNKPQLILRQIVDTTVAPSDYATPAAVSPSHGHITVAPTDTTSKPQHATALLVEPARQEGDGKNADSGIVQSATIGTEGVGQPGIDSVVVALKEKNTVTHKKKPGKNSRKNYATAEGNKLEQIQTEEDVRKANIRAWQDAILAKPTAELGGGCMENKIAYSVPSQTNNLEQAESEAEKSVNDHSFKKETDQHELAVYVPPAHSRNTLTPTSNLEVICKRASKLMRETGRGFFPVNPREQTVNEGFEPETIFLRDLFDDSGKDQSTHSKNGKSKWNFNAPLFIPKALRQQESQVATESVESQKVPTLEFRNAPSDEVLLKNLDLYDIRGLLQRQNSPPQELPQKFSSAHPGIIEDGSEYEDEDEESTAYNYMEESRHAGLSPRLDQVRKPKLIKKKEEAAT